MAQRPRRNSSVCGWRGCERTPGSRKLGNWASHTQTTSWVLETESVPLNNYVCWFGSLDGFAEAVLPACERAVALALSEDAWRIRDSRGLARALTGNLAGAVADFTVFVEGSKERYLYQKDGRDREAWIVELAAGRNPFDAATLDALRSE